MADLVKNEVLCFISNHFKSANNSGIVTVVSTFYNEDEILVAKNLLHDICVKNLTTCEIPRNIARKGENKRKADTDDLMKYFALLDEQKFTGALFVAANLKRVPLFEPGSVDLCFMQESIADMKKQIDELIGIKKSVSDLQDSMRSLIDARRCNVDLYPFQQKGNEGGKQTTVPAMQPRASNAQNAGSSYAGAAVGMKEDSNLRVALPQSQHGSFQDHNTNSYQSKYGTRKKKPPVVGTAKDSSSCLKASAKPREFHLYIGNLDIDTKSDFIQQCIVEKGTNIRVLSSDIVRSSRFEHLRSVAAHVVIDARDKDKALQPDSWPEDITIRPWHVKRAVQNSRSGAYWGSADEWE